MTFKIDQAACIKCGQCASVCPVAAVLIKDGVFEIDMEKCVSCGQCATACPVDAVSQG